MPNTKIRPFRVDYFDMDEMQSTDQVLVKSVIVRTSTSEAASREVLENSTSRIIIRAYRFYKKLGSRKKDVYKSVEDLFPAKKAVQVMETIEKFKENKSPQPQKITCVSPRTLIITDGEEKPIEQIQPGDAVITDQGANLCKSTGHVTRLSDSSLYDEVCTVCGATDASNKLNDPCPIPSVQESTITDVDNSTSDQDNSISEITPEKEDSEQIPAVSNVPWKAPAILMNVGIGIALLLTFFLAYIFIKLK